MDIRNHFIDDLDKAWKMLSVQFGSLMAAVSSSWVLLDDATKEKVISSIHFDPKYALPFTFVLGVYVRLKKQPSISDGTPKE